MRLMLGLSVSVALATVLHGLYLSNFCEAAWQIIGAWAALSGC